MKKTKFIHRWVGDIIIWHQNRLLCYLYLFDDEGKKGADREYKKPEKII
jgi:hypothetical protein